MNKYQNAQNVLGQLVRATLFTAVITIAHPAEAESSLLDRWSEKLGYFPVPEAPISDQWFEEVRAYPVPEDQQDQAIQEFYITQTDVVVLERAIQASGLPLNRLEISAVFPVTWPDGCIGNYVPGIFCTMALVPGWVVVVSDGERS